MLSFLISDFWTVSCFRNLIRFLFLASILFSNKPNAFFNLEFSSRASLSCCFTAVRRVVPRRRTGLVCCVSPSAGELAPRGSTVYPKKYAHGFCFAVLCCGYTLTDFPIFIRLTSLALWQSNDCPSASKVTLMNMDKYFMWIHYERLHNHNKAKHNKTVCIFLGIYCNTVGLPAIISFKLPPSIWLRLGSQSIDRSPSALLDLGDFVAFFLTLRDKLLFCPWDGISAGRESVRPPVSIRWDMFSSSGGGCVWSSLARGTERAVSSEWGCCPDPGAMSDWDINGTLTVGSASDGRCSRWLTVVAGVCDMFGTR